MFGYRVKWSSKTNLFNRVDIIEDGYKLLLFNIRKCRTGLGLRSNPHFMFDESQKYQFDLWFFLKIYCFNSCYKLSTDKFVRKKWHFKEIKLSLLIKEWKNTFVDLLAIRTGSTAPEVHQPGPEKQRHWMIERVMSLYFQKLSTFF